MIKSIVEYDARRNRHGNAVVGKRERNGRPSRASKGEHLVYLMEIEGNPKLKVGRTGNLPARVLAYKCHNGGEARCVAQFFVPDVTSSVVLEAEVVNYLQARYPRSGREWFEVPEPDMLTIVSSIRANTKVEILRATGMPSAEEEQHVGAPDLIVSAVASQQYKAKRTTSRW